MTYREAYEKAEWKLERGEITIGEFDELTKSLDEEIRPRGEWIDRRIIAKDRSFDMAVCSNCQTEFSWDAETGISIDDYNFCPNCGADMRKRE